MNALVVRSSGGRFKNTTAFGTGAWLEAEGEAGAEAEAETETGAGRFGEGAEKVEDDLGRFPDSVGDVTILPGAVAQVRATYTRVSDELIFAVNFAIRTRSRDGLPSDARRRLRRKVGGSEPSSPEILRKGRKRSRTARSREST
jgi:hypothetical protein